MPKYIISVEGAVEEAIIDIMLESYLNIRIGDCLERGPIKLRSANSIKSLLMFDFDEKITLIRILDSTKEKFKLDKEYGEKIEEVIQCYYTKSEIEILYIIAEGKYDNYTNKYHNMKPSKYVKAILKMKKCKSYDFAKTYFESCDLIELLKEYKKIKNQSELCLYDFYEKYK